MELGEHRHKRVRDISGGMQRRISLDLLRWFVQLVSWIIPASYGIRLLQDIMLRGLSFRLWEVLVLAGMGLVLFIVAWLGLRRELAGT